MMRIRRLRDRPLLKSIRQARIARAQGLGEAV